MNLVLRLLRVKQWAKSVFVLPAPLFGYALTTPGQVAAVAATFIAFCFVSSAVYVFNDLHDAEADRHHRTKRLRPIASGEITFVAACATAAALLLAGLGAATAVGLHVGIVAAVYVVNGVLYTLVLKRRVVADVLSIALGFLLRVYAGAVAVGVKPSSWLMICGFCLALFLAFCKRRSEIGRYFTSEEAAKARPVLVGYSEEKLNVLTGSAATLTILTYMLFTVSSQTVQRHGTEDLIYTSPFVVYGVYRYLLRTLELEGEDALETLLRDIGFLVAGLGWLLSTIWVLGIV